MTNKVLLSLATVALFAATAKADASAYAVETTNSWFTTEANAANWTGEGVVVLNGTGVVCVDTSADNAATNSISAVPSGVSNVRITGIIANLCRSASVPAEYSDPLPQASITAVDGDTDAWYVWHCTNTTQGAWVQMTGATPEEGNPYDITIEFKNGYVRYAVGNAWLENNENSWITNAQNFAAITKVGLAGFGQFGEVAGLTFESFELVVDDSAFSAMGINTDDKTPAEISAALNEKGTNGLTKWESAVLGLDNSSTKPYTAPVQTSGNTLGFTIGNAAIGTYGDTGATVSFDVYECNADGTVSGESRATGNADNSYTATVTPDSSAVKYYKIKIKITK